MASPTLPLYYDGPRPDPWLAWIAELFCRVQGARFVFRLRPLPDDPERGVFYLRRPRQVPGVYVPRAERVSDRSYRPHELRTGGDGVTVHLVDGTVRPPDALPPRAVDHDVFYNAFVYASALDEREREAARGPIHGASGGIPGPPERFDRPVVNHLFAALGRRICETLRRDPADLFDPPAARVELTHDVDAVGKPLLLRLKQALLLGGCRAEGAPRPSLWGVLARGRRLDWVGHLCRIEKECGLRSVFFVYARLPVKGAAARLRRCVYDPAYSLEGAAGLRETLCERIVNGWEVGLHGSFDSFEDAARLRREKARLETWTGRPAIRLRQHWLRFSLEKTWHMQEAAGFQADYTFGFNDRPGFRAGLASAWHPYDPETHAPMNIRAVPTVLSDVQVFRYPALADTVVAETLTTPGEAAVLWHPHVMNPEYRLGQRYREVLEAVASAAAVGKGSGGKGRDPGARR